MTGEARSVRRLQILLHEKCSTGEDRIAAKLVIQDLGMTLSGEGAATLSARMSDVDFKRLFANLQSDKNALAVPEKLRPFVLSISEAPAHLSFK